jgi:hypothetical protein
MNSATGFTIHLPLAYNLAVMVLLGLSFEAFLKRNRAWAIPALLIYATTGMWYFLEVLLYPQNYAEFPPELIEDGYLQVMIFLVAFRCLVPAIAHRFIPRQVASIRTLGSSLLNADELMKYLVILWLLLLVYGLSRLDWNLMQALFPTGGRWAPRLWSRGAVEPGATGFIISSAGYLYTLVCAFFGVLLPLQKRPQIRLLTVFLILISWPSFLLSGTRNAFLAVALPGFFSYVLMSKQKLWLKILFTGGLVLALNYAFSVIITFRNTGYEQYLNNLAGGTLLKTTSEHQGLNMAQELFYINSFYRQGVLQLQLGMDYVSEMLNFIPRFLWPGKPILGKSYEELRGLYGTATLAAGFIGRGALNFGPWLGPLAPAVLLAVWSGFLTRLWYQSRYSVLRLGLFLTGLGITPNLGRDITLLVLWPIVFGYALVRYLEYLNQRKLRSLSILQE